MTPFDPAALLAMLLTFYPAPTVTNLRRARQERPEYFAGGVLFGSSGEKLRLPDGRIFDLIFDVGGAAARWQAIDVSNSGGVGGDSFELGPGPLAPLDELELPAPARESFFEQLAAEALGQVGAADDAIETHEATVAEHADPQPFDDEAEAAIGDGERVIEEQHYSLNGVAPSELLEVSEGAAPVLDGHEAEWDSQEIDNLPEMPYPPDPSPHAPPKGPDEELPTPTPPPG